MNCGIKGICPVAPAGSLISPFSKLLPADREIMAGNAGSQMIEGSRRDTADPE